MKTPTPSRARVARPRGFSLLEVLAATAIIVVLLGLLLVSLNGARNRARVAKAQAQLSAISGALVQFENDHGYLPPILNAEREFLPPPPAIARGADDTYRERINSWYSATSLVDFLVGPWDWTQDGYGATGEAGDPGEREVPRTGIRSPGSDGVWGQSADLNGNGRFDVADRAERIRRPGQGGAAQVYGPYLDLDQADLIGSTRGDVDPASGKLIVFAPGEAGYRDDDPKVLLDPFGSAIEYFRRPYVRGSIGQAVTAGDYDGDGELDGAPSLSDVARLRPWEIGVGADTDGLPDANGDTSTTLALSAAKFALFSAGPDRAYSAGFVRVDEAELNRDNIVELSP